MTDPTEKGSGKFVAVLAAGSVALLLLGSLAFVVLQLRAPADRFAACREVRIGGGQTIGGAFQLTDHNGVRVDDGDVVDRPALLYFGYTFCPDVCPLDVVRNVDAVDLLAEDGREVRPVFVTIDPERDTVEALNDYAFAMHPQMVALTGSVDEVKATVSKFGGSASKQDGDSEFYLMSHTTLSYLMLPGEGVVALFTQRLSAEELAEKTACYLDAA